jgi:hypothetical protein
MPYTGIDFGKTLMPHRLNASGNERRGDASPSKVRFGGDLDKFGSVWSNRPNITALSVEVAPLEPADSDKSAVRPGTESG